MKLCRLDRWLCAGLLCIITVLSMSIGVMAQAKIDLKQPVSVTVSLTSEDAPVQGVDFRIYQVAAFADDGSPVLADDFAAYSVSLEDSDFDVLCQTLAGYILRDDISPKKTAVTDESGTAVLEGGLLPGLYLVMGGEFVLNGKTCLVEPALIWLPYVQNDVSLYDVLMKPKWEILENNDRITVMKVWEDKGHTDRRPAQIQVQLIDSAAGQVWETVSLSAENNWRHTWDDLPEGHSWYVTEQKVPKGYTVTVVRNGHTVVLTNTYRKPPKKPDTPGRSDPTPETPDPTSGDSGPGPNILPQTGTLKWLVPILAGCGMILFLIGWIWRRRDAED